MEAPRVLVVAERGARVRVHRGTVIVESSSGRYTIPVADVDRIVLATSQISITTAAIRRLARLGIDIVVLDARGTPIVTLSPPWINATSAVRVAQYRATSSKLRLEVARGIVAAKLESQAALLECLESMGVGSAGVEAEAVRGLARDAAKAESVERLRVLEAVGARRYWGVLASAMPGELGFRGRDPDAGDDINTVLNYLYALLYSLVHRYLVLYGLDPYVGFMHRDRSGAESLVYDVAEVFRVVSVDALVYYSMVVEGFRPSRDPGTGLLSPEARVELISRFRGWVSRRVRDASSGRMDTIEGHVARQARSLASSLRRGSVPGFYTMPGGGQCPW